MRQRQLWLSMTGQDGGILESYEMFVFWINFKNGSILICYSQKYKHNILNNYGSHVDIDYAEEAVSAKYDWTHDGILEGLEFFC